jgi:hypothetical protein
MVEEIKLKKTGKGRTIVQQRRNSILNSGSRLGYQAAVIAPKTNIVGRSYLTNDYLTQATTKKGPKNPMLAALLFLSRPQQLAMGQFSPELLRNRKNLIVISLREGQRNERRI